MMVGPKRQSRDALQGAEPAWVCYLLQAAVTKYHQKDELVIEIHFFWNLEGRNQC